MSRLDPSTTGNKVSSCLTQSEKESSFRDFEAHKAAEVAPSQTTGVTDLRLSMCLPLHPRGLGAPHSDGAPIGGVVLGTTALMDAWSSTVAGAPQLNGLRLLSEA